MHSLSVVSALRFARARATTSTTSFRNKTSHLRGEERLRNFVPTLPRPLRRKACMHAGRTTAAAIFAGEIYPAGRGIYLAEEWRGVSTRIFPRRISRRAPIAKSRATNARMIHEGARDRSSIVPRSCRTVRTSTSLPPLRTAAAVSVPATYCNNKNRAPARQQNMLDMQQRRDHAGVGGAGAGIASDKLKIR